MRCTRGALSTAGEESLRTRVRKSCAPKTALILCSVFVGLGHLSAVHAQGGGAVAAAEGTIAGKVLDGVTGDPIIEAGVEVTQTGKRVRTDLDGKFSIKLPPGNY